jgi:hypothetical protein
VKLGAAQSQGTRGRAGSSPDDAGTCQHRQIVRVRQARRKGVTTVNQCSKASQEKTTSSNLADVGWVAARTRATHEELPRPVDVADREATSKACGVDVAKLQGHSWAPNPTSGSRGNVGTIPTVPFPAPTLWAGGKVRCRPTPSGGGVGPVVVRVRESRSHGEGVQRVRGVTATHGGRR